MNGNNLSYKQNPANFLTHKVLSIADPKWMGSQDPRGMETGIHAFDILDLKPTDPNLWTSICSFVGCAGPCELKFWDRGAQSLHPEEEIMGRGEGYFATMRGSKETVPMKVGTITRHATSTSDLRRSDEAPIKAYWLPWHMNETYEMDLGRDAEYFFTAGLSGCTFVVAGDPRWPHVAHINRQDGAELERMFQKVAPTHWTLEEALARQGAMARGEAFNPRMPRPTKAETTSRQILHQELLSVVSARQAGRATAHAGNNFPVRNLGTRNDGTAMTVGNERTAGNRIFGVCDWSLHYAGDSDTDTLATVVGYIDRTTLYWRFFYQAMTSMKSSAYYGGELVRRGPLMCMICQRPAPQCTCYLYGMPAL